MSRPTLSKSSPTRRVNMTMTEEDHKAIEEWMWSNRVASWSEATRRLVKLGLSVDRAEDINGDLLDALRSLFDDYKMLADSGDAGFWSIEELDAGKKAMAALSKAEGRA